MACCYLRRDTEPVVFFLSSFFTYYTRNLFIPTDATSPPQNFRTTFINPTSLYLLISKKICLVCQTIYRIFYLSYNTLTKHIFRQNGSSSQSELYNIKSTFNVIGLLFFVQAAPSCWYYILIDLSSTSEQDFIKTKLIFSGNKISSLISSFVLLMLFTNYRVCLLYLDIFDFLISISFDVWTELNGCWCSVCKLKFCTYSRVVTYVSNGSRKH